MNQAVPIPTEITFGTAAAITIVIAALTTSIILIGWLYVRLTPARRRDLIELARAIRPHSTNSDSTKP